MTKLAVVGSGYVGTVVAACFAMIGYDVVGVEVDGEKLEALSSGRSPFFEPGLDELLRLQVERGRLRFTHDYADALEHSGIVFICVGTPPSPDGAPDMTQVESAATAMGAVGDGHRVVVTKSTVPIGSGRWLASLIEEPDAGFSQRVSLVSNPEFLREGSAVADFLHPDRVVMGSDDSEALNKLEAIYRPILDQDFTGGRPEARPHLVRTDLLTAETIKYAANAFLATKISFINEIATVCDAVGADVTEVASAIGLDRRIGASFLNAGVGWGGSCFGKDLGALAATARDHGITTDILDAVNRVNDRQIDMVVAKLQAHLNSLRGRRITLLGLAFKPGTDDVRDAPSLKIAARLDDLGALVSVYDPVVKDAPRLRARVADSLKDALAGADAAVLVTEWQEFLSVDLAEIADLMSGTVFLDGRNAFDPMSAGRAGLTYVGVGRPGPGGEEGGSAVVPSRERVVPGEGNQPSPRDE